MTDPVDFYDERRWASGSHAEVIENKDSFERRFRSKFRVASGFGWKVNCAWCWRGAWPLGDTSRSPALPG
ncbi:hypothetical protein O9993_11495 [Vibrio lentus]|nr:hypothetical protein [Vibrio lentus]